MTGIVARSVDGPVVAVSALGQTLPALPAPEITVLVGSRRQTEAAWSLGAAAAAVDLAFDEHIVALNGHGMARDPELPLVTGDTIAFMTADG